MGEGTTHSLNLNPCNSPDARPFQRDLRQVTFVSLPDISHRAADIAAIVLLDPVAFVLPFSCCPVA